MKYLNIDTYNEKDSPEVLSSPWFPITDERVLPWFNTPMGYDVAENKGGFPIVTELKPILENGTINHHKRNILDKVVLDENREFYSFYQTQPDNAGFYQPDVLKMNSIAVEEMIKQGESIATNHIQAPIDEYNKENFTVFANAHSCSNYKDDLDYIHQPFCKAVWNFNVEVWGAVDTIRKQIKDGHIQDLTKEAFSEMLPMYRGYDGTF